MNKLNILTLTASLVVLNACSGLDSYSEMQAINAAQATGSAFTRELTTQYRMYANAQLKRYMDYPDALHFARKGLAAARGETVLPEPVTDWNVTEQHATELAAARSRLIIAFDYGARESLPVLSAQAQGQFDCWIEMQEEFWTDALPSECKINFENLINQIETQLIPIDPRAEEPARLTPAAPVQPATELAFDSEVFNINPEEPMAPENAMYLLFFNWDSAKIGSGALSIIDAVITQINTSNPATIRLTGHTDTSGAEAYNDRLALKRAKAAKDQLLAHGIDASRIVIDAKGESDLLVKTSDNVREPANRRVNIAFE